jgi:hypothetical protein
MALVLCTGSDPTLLETRRMILERAGHIVVHAMNEREVILACKSHSFEVAVIGQSISPDSKRGIARLVRHNCPSARILELFSPHYGKTLEDADSWLEVPTFVPKELGDVVTRLAENGSA